MDRVRKPHGADRGRLDELNKAERKVAEVILLNPQQATRFSIAALAQAAKVSEPTVNRFCRSFGVGGYPELKLQLAQSLASGAAYVSRAVEADDDPAAYTQKIFGSAIASLDSACQALDPQQVSRAVDMMIQARQIHFFGLGASAPWPSTPSTSSSASTWRCRPMPTCSCNACWPRSRIPAICS